MKLSVRRSTAATCCACHSGRLLAAYVYADSGFGESTTDMIFAGHNLICENGSLLNESDLFTNGITYGDIDVERLVQEAPPQNTWQTRPVCDIHRRFDGPARV